MRALLFHQDDMPCPTRALTFMKKIESLCDFVCSCTLRSKENQVEESGNK
eukprot:m.166892 g.166892  ORF g.166892 m.166892 type:complete len:50 (-) comp53153_c0_seq3:56-205(-)